MCQPALNSKPTKARGAMTRCKASSDECWAVRLTDRAKLRATHRPAQGCGTKSVPRQGHNTPLPLKRTAPASFKRLLGSGISSPKLAPHPSTQQIEDQCAGDREADQRPKVAAHYGVRCVSSKIHDE